jgi:hypothetical protein
MDAPVPAGRPDLLAEPLDEFFGDEDAADIDADSDELFAEALDEAPDDAPVITVPLQPPPRPQPTQLHPNPASRAPPPVRQPGAGLLESNVGAPARARPIFQPPPRERT